MTIFRHLLTWLRAFKSAEGANVAMIFAIALVPLSIAAGAGLDMARAMVVKNNMHEALDAAALAVGASQGLSLNKMQILAQKFFDANYTAGSSYGAPGAVVINVADQKVTLTATDAMPTTLIALAGIKTMPITTSSTVVWGQTKLWVSLVLDNTGSMLEGTPDSKITVLKAASHNLLTMLQGAASNPGDVKVAIIPFTKDVNLGNGYKNDNWIDWSLYGTCNIRGISDQGTCTSTHGTWSSGWGGWGGGGGSCNIPGYNSQSKCQNATGTWTAFNKDNWNGCVTDRGGVSAPSPLNFDELNAAPNTNNPQSFFPAEQYSACPEQLLPLTDDWTALGNEIDGMVANGNTNQTIGLVWGWQALSNGAPLDPGTLPDHTQQVIILLSDGLNTQNRWDLSHRPGDAGQLAIDTREEAACANARAAGITIYAVYVDIGGLQGNADALQACASDPSKYFDLQAAGQIVDAFNQIGTQITQLRVAK